MSRFCQSCDICQRTIRKELVSREELGKAQVRQKCYYDRKAKEKSLEVGDKVLLLCPTDSNKLIMQCKDQYQVEAKRSVNNCRINIRGKSKTYHINLLKKYQERAKDGEVVEAVHRNSMMVGGVVLERSFQPSLRMTSHVVPTTRLTTTSY